MGFTIDKNKDGYVITGPLSLELPFGEPLRLKRNKEGYEITRGKGDCNDFGISFDDHTFYWRFENCFAMAKGHCEIDNKTFEKLVEMFANLNGE